MRQFEAKILIQTLIAPNLMHLAFEWPLDLPSPRPGQFFTVLPKMTETGAGTLLRRPLAFAAFHPANAKSRHAIAHSIYQIRGAGTKALAIQEPGTSINIIGPLGNSFPEPSQGTTALIAGGGIGIGPMLFLATWLREKELPYRFVAGFRSISMVPFREYPQPTDNATTLLPADTTRIWHQLLEGATISTDDGSLGIKGTVLDALTELDAISPATERWHLYGCGPGPMLAALARFTPERRAAAHFSAEQWMACGVGACHGCVLPAATGGYLRVCADGPVFDAEAIDWETSAL